MNDTPQTGPQTGITGPICQSCGMPMQRPEDYGTNSDETQNTDYCHFCYQKGDFTAKMNMAEYIDMQVRIAMSQFGMQEAEARKMAESTIPNLKRWRDGR